MNYSKLIFFDVANGPGIRISLFVSGCNIHCNGCFNKEAWDFNYGKRFTDDTIDYIIKHLSKNYYKGLTILGGEPMDERNQEGVWNLIYQVRENINTYDKSIWLYTGYEQDKIPQTEFTKQIIENVNVVVSGPFDENKLDKSGKFRGSTNQVFYKNSRYSHE